MGGQQCCRGGHPTTDSVRSSHNDQDDSGGTPLLRPEAAGVYSPPSTIATCPILTTSNSCTILRSRPSRAKECPLIASAHTRIGVQSPYYSSKILQVSKSVHRTIPLQLYRLTRCGPTHLSSTKWFS